MRDLIESGRKRPRPVPPPPERAVSNDARRRRRDPPPLPAPPPPPAPPAPPHTARPAIPAGASIRERTRALFEAALEEAAVRLAKAVSVEPPVAEDASSVASGGTEPGEELDEDEMDAWGVADGTGAEHEDESVTRAEPADAARELEAALQEHKAYRSQARLLLTHLREEGDGCLADRLLLGEVSAAEAAAMSGSEMGTAEGRRASAALRAEGTRKRQVKEQTGAPSDSYTCPSCKGTRSRVLQLSVLRDIGKSETWGRKDGATSKIRVTCESCGHAWTVAE